MSLSNRLTALAQAVGADIKALQDKILTHAVEPYILSMNGTVTVKTGTSKIVLEDSYSLQSVRAYVNTTPAGGPITVDVNKNGTTIYGTQTNRPTISAGTNSGLGGTASGGSFVAGDILSVDVDTIGSTTAGSDLTVTIRLRRTT